ncbi:MAG: N-methyl-L-tryptophan oxidase [Planctomycetota bacterium]|nr:N-methyl-L-tryptophan oxidase [Planctomycetota bacterium]
MPVDEFDVAVLGLGGMGSQTLLHLAKAGCQVIGVDQYFPPHTHGSSHGLSRLIRKGYFEHPEYVPLIERAFELWEALQQQGSQTLWTQCGILEGGPKNGTLVQGLQKSIEQHNLDLPIVSAEDVARRYPGFNLPSHWQMHFEKEAGFLRPEACIETALGLAKQLGATQCLGHPIEEMTSLNRGVEIVTRARRIIAAKVVLTLGPWSPLWKSHVDIPIRLLHKRLLWFRPSHQNHWIQGNCPCFLFESENQFFYGMPAYDQVGLKLARHDGGVPIQSVHQQVDAAEEEHSVLDFAARHFTPSLEHVEQTASCRYSMSADEQFVFGQSPLDPRIHYLAGLSGHGFKFATVLGEVMSRWVLSDELAEDAQFLHRRRFTSN